MTGITPQMREMIKSAVVERRHPGALANAMLLCASSPYAKRGAPHDAHKRCFGKAGPVMVWKWPTRLMNLSVKQSLVDELWMRATHDGHDWRRAIAKGLFT
jgi:hypothetical protein